MTPVERNVMPVRGPRFFREGGEVLFQFVVDPTNIIGPRPAKRSDQENHAGAWAEFSAAEALSPLDRDADGEVGGSLPAETSVDPGGCAPAVYVAPPTPAEPRTKRAYKRRG